MSHMDFLNFDRIPKHMMDNINFYVTKGESLGGFLTKVFSNDLFGAVSMADDYNVHLIPLYVKYIYNECPLNCHGSIEHVNQWIEKKRKENE